MAAWRKDYFDRCHLAMTKCGAAGPRVYLENLWNWIEEESSGMEEEQAMEDSRRVAVMMGRPIKEDLINKKHNRALNKGEGQAMQSIMQVLWSDTLDYATITWRTRGYLCSTPEKIQERYTRGPITKDMIIGIFDHQYRPFYEPRPKGTTMLNQKGFRIRREQTQRQVKELKCESSRTQGEHQSTRKKKGRS